MKRPKVVFGWDGKDGNGLPFKILDFILSSYQQPSEQGVQKML